MLSLPFTILTFASIAARSMAQSVFAHVIVGNTYNYNQNDWAFDVEKAANASIDGFALNIGYLDTKNLGGVVQSALSNAYNAAEAAGFKMFLSFDYAAQGAWDEATVISTIQAYSSHSSQFTWQGKPLVSTFEGPDSAGDWGDIKAQTNCFFMPDYSSQGAAGAAAKPNVDGLLSWNAWPNGNTNMTSDDDAAYVSALAGRPFMMPVSPWFYTNLPNWDKNWMWYADHLWHTRWDQVLDIMPAFVEILTWNDYGESHYIGPHPPDASAFPPGSEVYVANNPHDAWLQDLPHYIAAYKNQTRPDTSHVTFWYRPNPVDAGSTAGTTCNTPTQGQDPLAPQDCAEDGVFFTAFVADSAIATVTVVIGGTSQSVTATAPGIFHASVPFGDIGDGSVSVSVSATDGTQIGPIDGATISTDPGTVNFNAWVGGS